jgi:hypothetical protein
MNQQVLEQVLRDLASINAYLAWHAQLQTYLLIGLAAYVVYGLLALSRRLDAVKRMLRRGRNDR